jgi:hypothetical protein
MPSGLLTKWPQRVLGALFVTMSWKPGQIVNFESVVGDHTNLYALWSLRVDNPHYSRPSSHRSLLVGQAAGGVSECDPKIAVVVFVVVVVFAAVVAAACGS